MKESLINNQLLISQLLIVSFQFFPNCNWKRKEYIKIVLFFNFDYKFCFRKSRLPVRSISNQDK